jgi:hypothetical protein
MNVGLKVLDFEQIERTVKPTDAPTTLNNTASISSKIANDWMSTPRSSHASGR